jgi:co-chaperonin GroES (HSP10)
MIDLDKIRPINNYVLVRVEHEVESVRLRSGLTLTLDTSYDLFKHSPTQGVVVALPEKLNFSINGKGLNHLTQIEAEIGDEVIFHYLVFHNAVHNKDSGNHKYFIQEGQLYLFVNYDQLFLALRPTSITMTNLSSEELFRNSLTPNPDEPRYDKVIMLNGYLLVEPIKESFERLTDMGLIVPEYIKDANNATLGRVRYMGSRNKAYKYNIAPEDDPLIQIGDIVAMDKSCHIPLQYALHNPSKLDYFRVERRNILAVMPKVTA